MSLASQITMLVRDVIKELARIADALEALAPQKTDRPPSKPDYYEEYAGSMSDDGD